MLDQIRHLCAHQKDLAPGKWVEAEGRFGPDETRREIPHGVARYNATVEKPQL